MTIKECIAKNRLVREHETYNINDSDKKIIEEIDDNGNIIYHIDRDGFEWWREYDENGKVIYFKNNKGVEEWWEDDNCLACYQNKWSLNGERLIKMVKYIERWIK